MSSELSRTHSRTGKENQSISVLPNLDPDREGTNTVVESNASCIVICRMDGRYTSQLCIELQGIGD